MGPREDRQSGLGRGLWSELENEVSVACEKIQPPQSRRGEQSVNQERGQQEDSAGGGVRAAGLTVT